MGQGAPLADFRRAQQVRDAHENELLAKPNVVGLGVGLRHQGGKPSGEVCIVAMVRTKVPREDLAPGDVIPTEIDGVPVDVQEVGDLEAM